MDAKSSTSRKTSLHKFKLKAKNHLFASSATIREIAQVPIPEQPLGDRVVSYQQPDGSTVKKKLAAEVLIQEDDEVVAKLRDRLAKDVSSPISTRFSICFIPNRPCNFTFCTLILTYNNSKLFLTLHQLLYFRKESVRGN
jgi:hypothetical protein